MAGLSEYKLIDDTDTHFHLEHPEAGSLKIAKDGLSEPTLASIAALGQQNLEEQASPADSVLDDVGANDPAAQLDPNAPPDRAPASDPGIRDFLGKLGEQFGIGSISTGPGHRTNRGELVEPAAPTALAPVGTPAPASEAPAAAAVDPASLIAAAPAAPRTPTNEAEPYLKDMSSAFDLESAGLRKEAEAQSGAAREAAAVHAQQQADLRKMHETYIESNKEIDTEQEALQKAYTEGKIDPNRYWKNLSTPGKITSVLSLILGGIGGGLQGKSSNVGLDLINKAIDDDIKAQEHDQNKNFSLFKMGMEKYGRADRAYQYAQSNAIAMTQADLARIASKFADPQAQGRMMQLNAHLQQKKVELNRQLSEQSTVNKIIRGGVAAGDVNESRLPKEIQEKAVTLPNGQLRVARSKEDATKVKEFTETLNPILVQLDRLDKLGPSALQRGSAAYNQAQAIRSNLIPLVNENAGLKRLSKEDIENIDQQFRDPTSFQQLIGGKARSDTFRKFLSEKGEGLFKSRLMNYQPSGVRFTASGK